MQLSFALCIVYRPSLTKTYFIRKRRQFLLIQFSAIQAPIQGVVFSHNPGPLLPLRIIDNH